MKSLRETLDHTIELEEKFRPEFPEGAAQRSLSVQKHWEMKCVLRPSEATDKKEK